MDGYSFCTRHAIWKSLEVEFCHPISPPQTKSMFDSCQIRFVLAEVAEQFWFSQWTEPNYPLEKIIWSFDQTFLIKKNIESLIVGNIKKGKKDHFARNLRL